MPNVRIRGLHCALVLSCVTAAGSVAALADDPSPKPMVAATEKAAAPPAPGYAEPGACATCHEEEAAALARTKHGKTGVATWDGARGCESCHGPGASHVAAGGTKETIKNPGVLPATELNAICLTCHERGEQSHWTGSPHEGRGLACTSCHSIHHAASPATKLLAKAT